MEQNKPSPAASPLSSFPLPEPFSTAARAYSITPSELSARIESEIIDVPARARLREFNHDNLKIISKQLGQDLSKARVLDVGASVHGYALECAMELGYKQYIGIDLGVSRNWSAPVVEVSHNSNRHLLCQMDAHRLWIDDDSVDVVLCLSGFEHYLFPELALQEIMRVLRKGGVALISYEPIWTSSYGHHLHHFGLGFEQVPPWSHLLFNQHQMAEMLAGKPWPVHCPIDRAQAVEWTYVGRDINRQNYHFHHKTLRELNCKEVVWLVAHEDNDPKSIASVDYVASMVPYSRSELLTRGFSFCFRK